MHRLPPVFTRTDTLFPYTSRFRSWVSHPQGLGDPSALIDEDARRLWLGNVREARPIYRQPIQTLIASMSLPFLGLIGFGLAIWENRRNPARPRGWLEVATDRKGAVEGKRGPEGVDNGGRPINKQKKTKTKKN